MIDASMLIPIASLVLGALLGILTSVVSSSVQQKNNVALKFIDTYLEVRRELVDVISPLTNIPLEREIDAAERTKKRDEVVSLFYRHFDFLPGPVLDAMVCLEACLDRPEIGLFELKDGMLLKMNPSRVPAFVESCSLLLNSRLYVPIALNSGNPVVRMNQSIRLHARNVLMVLNAYASIDDMMCMIEQLKKGRKA
jgi:hypothetical protein